jgi:hypothetical protein
MLISNVYEEKLHFNFLVYISSCDDPEHIPNRNKPDFAKNLKKEMVMA